MKILRWIDNILSTAEKFLLVLFLSLMILLASFQVVLRNFFDWGIFWIDSFLRHLVLFVGFIGGAQATRIGKHINVDILARLLKESKKLKVAVVVNLFAMVVTAILAVKAWEFVTIEKEFGDVLSFGIQTWIVQIIIPLGFILIGFRFFYHFCDSISKLIKGEAEE
ncbi:MAG: TRAP transporter small permease [bacterium]|nr:TRAP transporter small permease [bacterium]